MKIKPGNTNLLTEYIFKTSVCQKTALKAYKKQKKIRLDMGEAIAEAISMMEKDGRPLVLKTPKEKAMYLAMIFEPSMCFLLCPPKKISLKKRKTKKKSRR